MNVFFTSAFLLRSIKSLIAFMHSSLSDTVFAAADADEVNGIDVSLIRFFSG